MNSTNQNGGLSDLEYALAGQEWELMRYRSDYAFSQSSSIAASGSLGTMDKITGNASNGTDRGGNKGPSHATACPIGVFDDLPSIRSETDTLPDKEDKDDPRPYDAYSLAGASEPYDDLPSVCSETPALPDDVASDSRPGSACYLENRRGLEYLPSIRSETQTLSRDEDDVPLSDDAYTMADGNDHYDDLPSIYSETRALSDDDSYPLIDSAHESLTDSMSSWATLASSGQSPISPESLVADVHVASIPTGTRMRNTLQRCSKALFSGIGCSKWRRIKHGILGSICAAKSQGK